MFCGKYKVYLDGQLVAEKENAITKSGRQIMLKNLMGQIRTIGGSIQMGIGSTPNNTLNPDGNPEPNGLITNTRLEFSTSEVPVSLSFLDNAGDFDAIVFKGSIPASGDGAEAQKIYELGIFPPGRSLVSSFSQTALFKGSQSDGWRTLGGAEILLHTGSSAPGTSSLITSAVTSFPFRVGDTALFVKGGQTITTASGGYSNMTTYGSEDYISLAISKPSLSTPTITIRFYVNANVYYTFTYNGTSGSSYQILNKSISQGVQASSNGVSPSWNTVRYAEITSDTDVVIDAVRINDNIEIDPTYGMVSRTVLDTPIIKNTAQSLEIEYYLSLTFNKTVG
jgi:predicted RNA-binding protein